MATINANLGTDAPIVTNERGAQQSELRYRFDLIDGPAMFRLAGVLYHGAQKYAPNNWRGIDLPDHLNHALEHIFAYLAGDTQDDHLGHAFCRMMMAVATESAETQAAIDEAAATDTELRCDNCDEPIGDHAYRKDAGIICAPCQWGANTVDVGTPA